MTRAGARTVLTHFVDPCLAKLVDSPPTGDQWVHEIKFDGYRLQAYIENGSVRLLTRTGLDWSGRFGTLCKDLALCKARSAIIDGEAIVEDERGTSSFSLLVADLKAKRSSRLVYIAFDLLFLDGEDLRALPLLERKVRLETILPRRKNSRIRFSQHLLGDGGNILSNACKLGLEGIISKRADKPYRSGRYGDWVKSKCIQTDEFVIGGYVESNAQKNTVGALVLGFYERDRLIYAGRVGTGFNRKSASELWTSLKKLRQEEPPFSVTLDPLQAQNVHWVKPVLVAQVEYRAWTADNILRHASFQALREDKPARQVRRPKAIE